MKYQTAEEIRHNKTNLSQKMFAKELGLPLRTYLDRITGISPIWKIPEIIKLSRINDGTAFVEQDSTKYAITVKEIKE